MADKIPTITESALTNGGARTVLTSTLAAGATTFAHYHTAVSETFHVVSGSFTAYTSPDMTEANLAAKPLAPGESVTIPANTLHKFLVGDVASKVVTTFEPGSLGFERAMLVMRGTQRDGVYRDFGRPDESNGMFLAVLAELTDSNGVGEAKEMLDGLYAAKGAEIEALKDELLGKYATEALLKRGTELTS